MSYIFSIAFMANALSMTAMLILLSIAGQSHMAADLGIVQAATSALFYAFSANARNIVLATANSTLAKSIFNIRVILLLPLVLASFWLSATLGGIEPTFATILILRRVVEWLGEVDLSERERVRDKSFALSYILVQALLFVIAALWLLAKMPYPLSGLFLWALLPMALSAKFSWKASGNFVSAMSSINRKIAPHFGSTLAIGASLYIFRLLLILILGKSVSGDLFAAFAIGGVLGSLTLCTFGPSIAFNEKVNGVSKLPLFLTAILWGFFCIGSLIIAISYLKPNILLWSGKEIFYWKAIGFSMIGGVIMTHAQLLRNRLLIHNENHDLFGPDLLMNILIITAIPLAYFSFGIDAIAGLALAGAILALVFYKSSERTEIAGQAKYKLSYGYLSAIVAVAVLVPIFFRLNSGIFLDKEVLLSGGRSLLSLPIPLSILFAYLAILIIGSYRSVHLSLSVVFFTFMLMIFSTVIVSAGHGDLERSKILLVIQYILPMGALVLGEMFKEEWLDTNAKIERALLLVLFILVPIQLVSSWLQDSFQLVSFVYLFSIYQHALYVPMIFIAAYLLAIFSIWPDVKLKKILLILSPMMGLYAAASLSLTAITFLFSGMFFFAVVRWRIASEKIPANIFMVMLSVCICYLVVEMSTVDIAKTFSDHAFEILNAWKFYVDEDFISVKSMLLGHVDTLDALKFPGIHNYYLDMIRNFGLVAVIPVLALLGYTVRAVYFSKSNFTTSPAVLGHIFVLFFLLVVDNSTQVSLRQPYSGVFTFFIWGLLIARISKINKIQRG